jgi:hypothetical protein
MNSVSAEWLRLPEQSDSAERMQQESGCTGILLWGEAVSCLLLFSSGEANAPQARCLCHEELRFSFVPDNLGR